MNKYIKPKFEEIDLGENPFLTSLEIKVNSIKSNDKYKVHDGQSDEQIYELANFEFEAVPYCKVFADSERRLHMVGLSSRAIALLMWLFYEVKMGQDWFWLNKVRYMEENKISSVNTFKSALNEVMKKCYITKTIMTDVYWLNPHFFFNGNRLKSFPDNITVRVI